jgi:hypothetical protein
MMDRMDTIDTMDKTACGVQNFICYEKVRWLVSVVVL